MKSFHSKSLRRRIEGIGFLVAYTACIPLANWFIGHVGTTCPPGQPCLIPVAPGGISAPSGVLMVGLALVLRDLVQRRLGIGWGIGAILVGATLSAVFAPPSLVIASVAAFVLSEAADFAVYTPLQRRGLVLAVFASSTVGLVVDSVLFLHLAFDNLAYLPGQIIGKAWMVLLSLPVVTWLKHQDEMDETAAIGMPRPREFD